MNMKLRQVIATISMQSFKKVKPEKVTPSKQTLEGTATYLCDPSHVVKIAAKIKVKDDASKALKVQLNNLVRQLTSRNIDFGYGKRGGTPPRGKTRTRMQIQKKFGLTEFAKRLPSGGHPTKKHTIGRMEMFA